MPTHRARWPGLFEQRLQRVSEIRAQGAGAVGVVVELVDEADGVGLARAGEGDAERLGHRFTSRMVVDDEAAVSLELPFLCGVERLAQLRLNLELARIGLLEKGRVVGEHQRN